MCKGISEALRDPRYDEILKECKSDDDKKFVNLHKYARLLYAYRSRIIHEAREHGYVIEDPDDEAHYLPFDEDPVPTLVYTVCFIRGLLETALTNLEKYYRDKKISPYARYEREPSHVMRTPHSPLLHHLFKSSSG